MYTVALNLDDERDLVSFLPRKYLRVMRIALFILAGREGGNRWFIILKGLPLTIKKT